MVGFGGERKHPFLEYIDEAASYSSDGISFNITAWPPRPTRLWNTQLATKHWKNLFCSERTSHRDFTSGVMARVTRALEIGDKWFNARVHQKCGTGELGLTSCHTNWWNVSWHEVECVSFDANRIESRITGNPGPKQVLELFPVDKKRNRIENVVPELGWNSKRLKLLGSHGMFSWPKFYGLICWRYITMG